MLLDHWERIVHFYTSTSTFIRNSSAEAREPRRDYFIGNPSISHAGDQNTYDIPTSSDMP